MSLLMTAVEGDSAGESQGKPQASDNPETSEDGRPLKADGTPDQRYSSGAFHL